MVENKAIAEAFAMLKANRQALETILTFYRLKAQNTLATSKDTTELFQAQGVLRLVKSFEEGIGKRD